MSRLLVPFCVAALLSTAALAQDAGRGNVGEDEKGKAQVEQTTPAAPQKSIHDVLRGDTMWGISGRYWNSRSEWPRLWSFNPQVRNPHWIFPGEKISLVPPPPPPVPEPVVREIKLVVEKLQPEKEKVQPPAAGSSKAAADKLAAETAARARARVGLVEWRSQDFLATGGAEKIGTVENRQISKLLSTEQEDVQLSVDPAAGISAGARLTVYDDSREIVHPLTGTVVGRQIKVLGQLTVLRVENGTAWAKLDNSYDIVEEGNPVMKYREPVLGVDLVPSAAKVGGMVLAGAQAMELFTYDDMVFLDKGSDDGLIPGNIVDVPFPAGPIQAEGYTDRTDRPIARAVVVSTQPKTSTAWIMESRKAVEPGFRFTASADSP